MAPKKMRQPDESGDARARERARGYWKGDPDRNGQTWKERVDVDLVITAVYIYLPGWTKKGS